MTVFNPGGDSLDVNATNVTDSESLPGVGDVLMITTADASVKFNISVGVGSATAASTDFPILGIGTAYLLIPFAADTVAFICDQAGPYRVVLQRGTAR